MKRIVIVLTFCLGLVLMVACAAPADAPAASPLEASAGAEPLDSAMNEDVGAAEADFAASNDTIVDTTAASQPVDANQSALRNRKIKRNAIMRIEAEDVMSALNQVTLLSVRYGGYTIGSRTWYVGEKRHANYSFAVPVEQFEGALEETRGLGDVQDENVTSQDVTAQYVDLAARIANLEVTAERIRGFLDDARQIDEALRVNNELSQIEGQIEQLKGQRNALAQQTSFSTISIEFFPPPPVSTTMGVIESVETWSPVQTFNAALEVLLALAQIGVDVGIWVVVVAAPALIILAIAFWLGRRLFQLGRRAMA